jgi:carboxymethylenebutenolidase
LSGLNRRTFIGAAVVGAVTPALAKAGPPPVEQQLGALRFLTATPASPSGNAVLLLPTIAGVDAYMNATAAELAGLGYLAVVWDPYGGDAVPEDMMAQLAMSKRLHDGKAIADLRALTEHMFATLGVRRLATLGWCMGGRFALLHAGLEPRVAAVATYFPTIYSRWPVSLSGAMVSKADFAGQTLDEFALASRIAGAVQINRPGSDLTQAADYAELQAALYSRKAPTTFSYFPEAQHAFVYRPETPADAKAAAMAWPATLGFLRASFAGG